MVKQAYVAYIHLSLLVRDHLSKLDMTQGQAVYVKQGKYDSTMDVYIMSEKRSSQRPIMRVFVHA